MNVSWQFLLTSLVVIVTPGPDIAFLTNVLMRSRNRRPALLAASGMVLAGGCHSLLGICGVTLLLYGHPGIFRALRTVGAAILAVYGLLTLKAVVVGRLGTREAMTPADPAPRGLRHPLLAGFGCTATNPKVGIFLLAFLPQFAPRTSSTGAVLLPLAAEYLGMVAGWLALWIYLLGTLEKAQKLDRIRPGIEIVLGTVLLVFAAELAVS